MAFRNNTAISYGLKGSADISGIMISGIRVEIECKSGMARQSPEQVKYQQMIESYGGVYLVARISDPKFVSTSVENICDQLHQILRLRGVEVPQGV